MPQPRKSTQKHLLHGTLANNPRPSGFKFDDELPTPPSWLSKDAKREFKRVIKLVADAGQEYLTRIDTAVLASYAASYAGFAEAERELITHGSISQQPITNRSSGTIVGYKEAPSPWLRISQTRQAAMLKAIQALGFDPRSRGSIDIPEPGMRRRASRSSSDTEALIQQIAASVKL